MFADNVHYREYQRLLVELHALIAAGRNQSFEARLLRNLMERAEADLSEDEIAQQVTSSWALNRELELVQNGKAKTAEERSNARQLAPVAVPA